MAKIICLKIKRRGDFFRLGAQILRRFMGFYRLKEPLSYQKDIKGIDGNSPFMPKVKDIYRL